MFYLDTFQGKRVLKSSILGNCEHFFTTRDFILHAGSCENKQRQAEENIEYLLKKIKISPNQLYRCKQMHTSNVEIASDENNFYDNTDGIILVKPNTATFLNFADCIPIILYDSVENIGGVVHAGWRGTAAKIQQAAVEKMCQIGSKPENIKAAIGAGIGICCFDVKEDVFDMIFDGIDKDYAKSISAYKKSSEKGKYFVDLKIVNKILLNNVLIKQIDIADYCTCCSNDVFFSYRKENGHTARHSAILIIRDKR